jgi:PAS domain S-box-containing protein
MRIDIPPDIRLAQRLTNNKGRVMPQPEPSPQIPIRGKAKSTLGDPDFQELFQSVYDGAIIATMAGKMVDANVRAINFLKYSREELLSLNLTNIISGANASTLTTLEAGVKKDRFILIQAYCTRKDKVLFPVEIAVNPLTVGGTEYLCCFIRDITWRQQAEEMLKTIHTAIQNAATGIVIADLNGQIDYANQAAGQLCGKTESLSGHHVQDLFPESETYPVILTAIKAGTNWSAEVLMPRKNGFPLYVQVSAAPNRNADEELTSMILSFLDISDRIRAQEANQQAERQNVMMESLGAACHHLGQPATVLMASLELMARVKDNDKALGEELLTSSIEAAESLRKMLHKLNDITEYKTTSYIDGKDSPGQTESRILDVIAR